MMTYSGPLAERVREVLTRTRGLREQRMFGGLCFLLHGNILVGVWKQSLVVRLGKASAAVALLEPDVQQFKVAGRPMRGWVVFPADDLEDAGRLRRWIVCAKQFVSTLPRK